jgi:hypothetical protein
MDINSQHHNLLGKQISPKSEDFCIWWPFYTLVTMATAAILNFYGLLYGSQTMDINSQHQNLLANQFSPKSEDFCILAAILDSKWPP